MRNWKASMGARTSSLRMERAQPHQLFPRGLLLWSLDVDCLIQSSTLVSNEAGCPIWLGRPRRIDACSALLMTTFEVRADTDRDMSIFRALRAERNSVLACRRQSELRSGSRSQTRSSNAFLIAVGDREDERFKPRISHGSCSLRGERWHLHEKMPHFSTQPVPQPVFRLHVHWGAAVAAAHTARSERTFSPALPSNTGTGPPEKWDGRNRPCPERRREVAAISISGSMPALVLLISGVATSTGLLT